MLRDPEAAQERAIRDFCASNNNAGRELCRARARGPLCQRISLGDRFFEGDHYYYARSLTRGANAKKFEDSMPVRHTCELGSAEFFKECARVRGVYTAVLDLSMQEEFAWSGVITIGLLECVRWWDFVVCVCVRSDSRMIGWKILIGFGSDYSWDSWKFFIVMWVHRIVMLGINYCKILSSSIRSCYGNQIWSCSALWLNEKKVEYQFGSYSSRFPPRWNKLLTKR